MNNKNFEVLAPAGSMEAVVSAINAGANAIYLGGQNFNARNNNKNFSDDDIRGVVELCSLYGVSVNLAVNTLVKDKEYTELIQFLDVMYKNGVTAFIIQDISLLPLIKARYPKVKVHASTQISAHSMLDVLHLKNLGFDRVVVARECSVDEIKAIKSSVDIELEVFVHGALCVSYSGQCLMSSLIGGRSGNRGRCAQPCRKGLSLIDTTIDESVMDGYLLSPKDISYLEVLDKLIECGVDSFKIEGRMKSPEYVYQATKSFCDKVDSVLGNEEFELAENKKRLLTVFNRGGEHSKGYINSHSSLNAMSIRTPKSTGTFLGIVTDYNKVTGKCVIKLQDDIVCGDGIEIWTKDKNHVGTNISKDGKYGQSYLVNIKGNVSVNDKVYKSYNKIVIDDLKTKYSKIVRKSEAIATFECVIGKPFTFSVTYNDITITKSSDIVEENLERPLSKDVVIQKLSKTGSTPFTLKFEDYEFSENSFLQLKVINELKRVVLEELEEKVKESSYRNDINIHDVKFIEKREHEKVLSVSIVDTESIEEIIDLEFQRLYIPFDNGLKNRIEGIIDICSKNNKELFVKLPTITDTATEITIDNDIEILIDKGVDGFLVSNYGQILMCDGVNVVLDYNFNVLNNKSVEYLESFEDVVGVTISKEATLEEIKTIENSGTEVIIHGRSVVMETRACPVGLYVSGKNEDKYCQRRFKAQNYVLRDGHNMDFPVVPNCHTCICQIYNSQILFMLDKTDDLNTLKSSLRIDITTEKNPREIITGYIDALRGNHFNTYNIKDSFGKTITKGHFYRGVE